MDFETCFTVWDAGDPAQYRAWDAAWQRAGAGEVFSHPAYVRALAGDHERARCAWARVRGAEILYAFVQRPITGSHGVACGTGGGAACGTSGGLSDIITALSYGGPLARGAGAADMAWFWQRLARWAATSGVVSEFVRFSPFATAQTRMYPGLVRRQAPHVVMNLAGRDLAEISAGMSRNARRAQRRAQANGLRAHIDATGARSAQFQEIYRETMARVDAAARFYYPDRVFDTIAARLPERFAYVYAMAGDRPVSVILVLFADDTCYFWLGGTRSAELHTGAAVFSYLSALGLAIDRGAGRAVFGGGVTNRADDALVEFKRRLSPQGLLPYYTGQRIFLADEYERLSGGALGDGGALADEGYFPAYRAPVQAAGGANTAVRERTGTRTGGHDG